MINARAETIMEKNAYKRPRQAALHHPRRRLLRVEEDPGPKTKQPMFIHRTDDEPHRLRRAVGAWTPEATKDDESDVDPVVHRSSPPRPTRRWQPIHDRMPVLLPPSAWDQWLDPDNDDIDTLGKLLVPAPAPVITARTRSRPG